MGLKTNDVDAVEAIVLNVICDRLKEQGLLEGKSIDRDKSVFELGLDSLGAVSIAMSLEKTSGKQFDGEILYQLKTVRKIASYLRNATALTAEMS